MRKKTWWSKIPDSWKVEALSMWHTFLPAFVLALAYSIDSHSGTPWTVDAAAAVLLAAIRSGFKPVWAQFVKLFE